jgi:8-oxo-dGTP pyrophosphatase MutT (NUDIX family)
MPPNSKVKAAHVIFSDPYRGILVLLNDKNNWMLPGGNIDRSDPSVRYGAWRELKEESGYKATEKNLEPVDMSRPNHQIFYYKAGRHSKPIDWDTIFKTRTHKKEAFDYAFVVPAGRTPSGNIQLAVLDKYGNFIEPEDNNKGRVIKPTFRWGKQTIGQLQEALEGTYFQNRLIPLLPAFKEGQIDAFTFYEDKKNAVSTVSTVSSGSVVPAGTVTDYGSARFMQSVALLAAGFAMGAAVAMMQ